MSLRDMIAMHPHVRGATNNPLIDAAEMAAECASICLACADACLGEDMVAELTQCIRLDLDCADVCAATARLALRRAGSNEAGIQRLLQVCAEQCAACAEECAKHAEMHDHCRICTDVCRRCEAACRAAAATITP